MTNQMPERIYAQYCGGGLSNGDQWYEHKLADTTEYLRADLAQKTVTREEVVALLVKRAVDSGHFKASKMMNLEAYEYMMSFEYRDLVDYLIQSGVVKVSE